MVNNKKKKRKAVAPKDETPEQRTNRLANFRVSRVVKDINSVRMLAGSSYTLSLDQKAEILVAMKAAIEATESVFAGQAAAAVGFQLSK